MRPTEGCGGRGQAPGTAGQQKEDASIFADRLPTRKQTALTRLGEMLEAAKKTGVVRRGPDKAISSKEEPIRQQLSDLGIDKKVSPTSGLSQLACGKVAR